MKVWEKATPSSEERHWPTFLQLVMNPHQLYTGLRIMSTVLCQIPDQTAHGCAYVCFFESATFGCRQKYKMEPSSGFQQKNILKDWLPFETT